MEGALLANTKSNKLNHPKQQRAGLSKFAVKQDRLTELLDRLTSEQRQVLNKITTYIANGQQGPGQLQLVLGPPGSGKTHLVNTLRAVGASFTPPFALEAVTYTGSAASLIGGATINSLFSIPIDAGNGEADEVKPIIASPFASLTQSQKVLW